MYLSILNDGSKVNFQIIFINIIFLFLSGKNDSFCELSTQNMVQNGTHLIITESSPNLGIMHQICTTICENKMVLFCNIFLVIAALKKVILAFKKWKMIFITLIKTYIKQEFFVVEELSRKGTLCQMSQFICCWHHDSQLFLTLNKQN